MMQHVYKTADMLTLFGFLIRMFERYSRPSAAAVIVIKNGMSLEQVSNTLGRHQFLVGFPLSARFCANEQF
jgi:hypothetical protein